jgi:L-alanine-DL-glutamate epimerase-like enolase superfamily enzyme
MRTFQAAQLAGGAGGIDIVEGIPAVTAGVDSSAYSMRDGRLLLPDAPGFGLELRSG